MNDNKTQRKVWMSPELKQQLVTYWRTHPQYRSESHLLTDVVRTLANGIDESQLAATDSPGKASARIWIDRELWDLATTRANATGLSMYSAVRRLLMSVMESDGTQGG